MPQCCKLVVVKVYHLILVDIPQIITAVVISNLCVVQVVIVSQLGSTFLELKYFAHEIFFQQPESYVSMFCEGCQVIE